MSNEIETLERSFRQGPEYVDTAEQAKLIRAALKRAFPGVKFSVRLSRYSGGSSIRAAWTDGPTEREVRGVTAPFEGGGFDGMIDLAYNKVSWLLPDGTAAFAHSGGTEGSRGSVRGYDESRPHPDARLVMFSGDYVFTDRELTEGFLEKLEPNIPVNLEGYERQSWRWRESQRWAVESDGSLREAHEYA